jgi:hypothetical protein
MVAIIHADAQDLRARVDRGHQGHIRQRHGFLGLSAQIGQRGGIATTQGERRILRRADKPLTHHMHGVTFQKSGGNLAVLFDLDDAHGQTSPLRAGTGPTRPVFQR